MSGDRWHDWQALQRLDIAGLTQAVARWHPELRAPVDWAGVTAIAAREGIRIQHVSLSRPAQLVRYRAGTFIQLEASLSRADQALLGMHELCHFWRDDPGEPCYFNGEDDYHPSPCEEFADIFAWSVTSTARIFVPGLRAQDFPP